MAILESISILADTAGVLEESFTGKVIILLLKLVSFLLEFTFETATLVNAGNLVDDWPENDTTVVMTGNYSTVYSGNLNSYKSALFFFKVFYGLGIAAETVYLIYSLRMLHLKKERMKFLSVPITIFCELPMMISEVLMLKATGLIDWESQFWELVLHVVFILNMVITIFFDFVVLLKVKAKPSGIFLMSVSLLISCLYSVMVYGLVSIAMVGFHWFEIIEISDFGVVVVTPNTQNVMLILMNIGQVGQYIWSLILAYIMLRCFCAAANKKD